MLQKTLDEIARCLKHASDAIDRANKTDDPDLAASYLQMAGRWRGLATAAELADSLAGEPVPAAVIAPSLKRRSSRRRHPRPQQRLSIETARR